MKMDPILFKGKATLCLMLLLLGAGCAKRSGDGMDVDDIQGKVDAIERKIRDMQQRLQKNQPEEAQTCFEEAEELLKDNQAQLASYPEVSLVEERLKKAPADLCWGYVNKGIQDFFTAVRKKSLEEARERLEKANKQFSRCEKKIEGRDDFVPLKMNLDSGPQAIADLEKQIEQDKEALRLKEALGEIDKRGVLLQEQMVTLEKKPDQPRLAERIFEDIGSVRKDLDQSKYKGKPEWEEHGQKVRTALVAMEQRCLALTRQGRLADVVERLIPRADKAADKLKGALNPREAQTLFGEALEDYRQCEAILSAALLEDPGSATHSFLWDGKPRNVAWLRGHCAQGQARLQKRAKRPLPALPVPQKKPASASKPPKEKKKVPAAAKKAPSPPSSGRNQRWD